MILSLIGLKSSTMASSMWINASTNVLANIWSTQSTAAAKIITNRNLAYVSGTNGNYRGVIHSTEQTMKYGVTGLAIITFTQLGLNGEWRVPFHVEVRRTS
jgi:hypothetical protein